LLQIPGLLKVWTLGGDVTNERVETSQDSHHTLLASSFIFFNTHKRRRKKATTSYWARFFLLPKEHKPFTNVLYFLRDFRGNAVMLMEYRTK
jgi:hypothetical protein